MNRQEYTDTYRGHLCDWLRANGLDPKVVVEDPKASIVDGKLTLLVKKQINGRDQIFRDEVVTETVTVPVLVEPDDIVANWLYEPCSACGR